jgi:acyl carrier protein
MGIDFLDLVFRLEKRYNLILDTGEWERLTANRVNKDITAGEVQFVVGLALRDVGRPVPRSLWNGVRLTLADTLGVKVSRIKPESRLVKDLGMT